LLKNAVEGEIERHSFTKNVTALSVKAKYLLVHSRELSNSKQEQGFISEVSTIRKSLLESAKNLEKYFSELGETIEDFLLKNEASYKSPQH
jgi:hypothetical protein